MNSFRSLLPHSLSRKRKPAIFFQKWKSTESKKFENFLDESPTKKNNGIFQIFLDTFWRDVHGISCLIRAAYRLRTFQKGDFSVSDVFEKTMTKVSTSSVCLEYEENKWTFKEVWEISNQIGNYFMSQGYRKGDVVALYMTNRPEFVVIWLGLSKIGIITALLNSNQRLDQLRHSLDIVESKAIIYGTELSDAISEAFDRDDMMEGKNFAFYSCPQNLLKSDGNDSSKFSKLPLSNDSKKLEIEIWKNIPNSKHPPLLGPLEKPKFFDTLFYIYTSGTTGLPKAVIFKHCRLLSGAVMSHEISSIKNGDVLYTCLPLYHTAANLVAIGQSLVFGNRCVIGIKFSASNFWRDCSQHGVTIAQYIGEICRHLLGQPESKYEKNHSIHTMMGNGLDGQIWSKFVDRFNIRKVTELYGASEGNCTMFNADGQRGAVGFCPTVLRPIFPIKVIKIDEVTGDPMRCPKTGLLIQCGPGEKGELMGKIDRKNPIREFPGYTKDPVGSQKKIVQNAFTHGDEAFRTGDYCVMDEWGYFYFVDRAGDNFRWKGENISTIQVESILTSLVSYKDVVFYGVKINGMDGKAGMATIADPERVVDLNKFSLDVQKFLPFYARPLFLRMTKEIEMTGTHKLKKVKLQSEGFDPSLTTGGDPVYFFQDGVYRLMDPEIFDRIGRGEIRLQI